MAGKTAGLQSTQARRPPTQGVQRTALRDLQAFCRQYNIEPADFMANAHLLRSGWQQAGGDYSRFIDWGRFNGMIAQNLSPAGRGLERPGFTRALQAELGRQRPERTAAAGGGAAHDSIARHLAEAGRPSAPAPRPVSVRAPARSERFIYNLRVGMIGHETGYTIVAPAPIRDTEQLAGMLKNPPEGFSISPREGRGQTPLSRPELLRLGDEMAARSNDPLGVVLMLREEIRERRRPGA